MSSGSSSNLERLQAGTVAPVPADLDITEFANQALMFFKPELTATPATLALAQSLVAGVLDAAGMLVNRVQVLNGTDLAASGAMRAHYGIINRIATGGPGALSAEGAAALGAYLAEQGIPEANVEGSFAFAERFPGGAEELGDFAAAATKLTTGTYVSTVPFDGSSWAVLNAFFPRSIQRFEDPASSLLVFDVLFDRPWAEFRADVVGTTDPKTSGAASVRGVLLENASELNVDISKDKNGVHGSAGAIEGAVEVARFLGDDPATTRFGLHAHQAGISADEIRAAFTTGIADLEAVFPDVEDLDSQASVPMFAKVVSGAAGS